jgi:hypothetical protein
VSFVTFFAHAFGQRYELPIPLSLFVFAGAGVVLLSFFLVLGRHVKPNPKIKADDVPPVIKIGKISSTVSLALFIGVLLAGFFGAQEVPENILPTLFWVVVWVGVSLSVGLFGDWTQPLNPFANISKLADNQILRKKILARNAPVAWPGKLGWWPAVVLYYSIIAGELIFNASMTVPANMATAFLMYAILCGVMGLLFGEAWLKTGEVYTVLFNTWGRLGYFRLGSSGRNGFLGGLDVPFSPSPSRIVFLLLLLGSVAFDGLLSTPIWNDATRSLAKGSLEYNVIALFCLALTVWWLFVIFTGFAIAVSYIARLKISPFASLARLLPSLLPISFGYLLAHYLQYLCINGQLMFPLIGNPIGSDSWPLKLPFPFNDAFEPDTRVLSTAAAWYIAVAVIVTAHILAVILAHRTLASSTASVSLARISEYPWIAAMVVYTMFSLWLLAQPLVQENSKAAIMPASMQMVALR